MMFLMAKTTGSPLGQLEDTLDVYFGQKAPALPKGAKDAIVNFAPWITLLLLLLSLPAVLALLGIGAILSPFSYLGGYSAGTTYTISLVLLAISVVLEALAIPGLFKKSKAGWNFVFYSSLVSIVSSLIGMQLFNMVIGAAISFYILFQVRSYYK